MRDIESSRAARRALTIAISANVAFLALKSLAAYMGSSLTLLSEALNSFVDLFISILGAFSLRAASLPPDQNYPFGRGKIEHVFAFVEALSFAAIGFYLFGQAYDVYSGGGGAPAASLDFGIAIILLCSAANIALASYLSRVASSTGSDTLKAEAQNHRGDVYLGLGVVAGLCAARVTGARALDPAIACVVAAIILYDAWRVARDSFKRLLDHSLSAQEIGDIREILGRDGRVMAYHKLRTRRTGASVQIDVHCLMQDDLTLLESHQITRDLNRELMARFPGATVIIHAEPYANEISFQREAGQTPADQVILEAGKAGGGPKRSAGGS